MKILVYGYGNPGRQDDGLGYEMAKKIESWSHEEKLTSIDVDSNYQLNIEDADIISGYHLVVFVDASSEEIKDFLMTDVTGEADVSFTTHAASPGYIVKLCHELFRKYPVVKLLHIKGYEWEFREGLSEKATQNLEKAFSYMKGYLKNFLNS